VVSSCEHGDEPSGSIKCEEFPDYLSVLLASQEGLCSMELVSFPRVCPSIRLHIGICRARVFFEPNL
jgi:hypothetical protein